MQLLNANGRREQEEGEVRYLSVQGDRIMKASGVHSATDSLSLSLPYHEVKGHM